MRFVTMPRLDNVRHERFAQLVASGKGASEAYRQSGASGKNADVQAAKLVVKGSIRGRVAELMEAQSQKSELSRDQAREFLTDVIRTPAGQVDEQSRLCQSYKVTPEMREIRMPDKLRPWSSWPSSAAGTNPRSSSMAQVTNSRS